MIYPIGTDSRSKVMLLDWFPFSRLRLNCPCRKTLAKNGSMTNFGSYPGAVSPRTWLGQRRRCRKARTVQCYIEVSRAGGNGNLKSLKAIPNPKLQMKVIKSNKQ